MIAAGLRLLYRMASSSWSLIEALVPLGRVRPGDIKYTAHKRSWDSFELKSSRAMAIMVVLAQAVARFVLIVRRRNVEDATLLLGSAKDLYAIIGIFSPCNSLLILANSGKREILGDAHLADGKFSDWTITQEFEWYKVFLYPHSRHFCHNYEEGAAFVRTRFLEG